MNITMKGIFILAFCIVIGYMLIGPAVTSLLWSLGLLP